MSLYAQRGVSAQKEEVHQAIQKLDQGLYAHAFCKIYPDFYAMTLNGSILCMQMEQAPRVF